jgi:ABC-type uncharacterized transport system YnjBCD ATPase subunit
MNNQPFEFIDGNSLEIKTEVIMKVFETIDDNCLVISIFGPQSSGKSTLLNFLFGCDFFVSEQRYKHGLYGTYFRIANS